ncbi:hypothetical protein GGR52DRAFT_559727 [Hypoxylon sp. FL1284]|nr:hypothetical protein GGR52DRAFT_559727 [Hypoxylon sp. FL1284]
MSPVLRSWASLGLLVLGARESYGNGLHMSYPYHNISISSTTATEVPSVTVSYTTTTTEVNCTTSETAISSSESTIITYPVPPPQNTTISSTESTIITYPVPPPHNTTIHTTTATTKTTVSVPCNTTITPTTISTSTITLPTFTKPTITPTSSVYNPCPTTCSISAGTVNMFFWPTGNTYTYPSTYVDEALDYTFTSPSVYLVINTIFGYNSLGRAGPSASSPVFAVDLDEVSTIAPDGATHALTLADLGTDCPQTEAASVLATAAPDPRCDPSLVAPAVVRSWALPCNACGRFGLFDPPYAIPAVSGGLVPTTVATTPQQETTTAASAPEETTPTPPTTGATSTGVTETNTPTTSVAAPSSTTEAETTPSTTATPTVPSLSSSTAAAPTTIATAGAARVTSGLAGLVLGLLASMTWM